MENQHVERTIHNGEEYAIVIRNAFDKEGLTFFTGDDYGIQVGIHKQKKGWWIPPHVHLPFEELKNLEVQEMFYIIEGSVTVGLFDKDENEVAKIKGGPGDIMMMISGHSVLATEDVKLIEIKQGPYRGIAEKRYF